MYYAIEFHSDMTEDSEFVLCRDRQKLESLKAEIYSAFETFTEDVDSYEDSFAVYMAFLAANGLEEFFDSEQDLEEVYPNATIIARYHWRY